jgi:hypothetical protein
MWLREATGLFHEEAFRVWVLAQGLRGPGSSLYFVSLVPAMVQMFSPSILMLRINLIILQSVYFYHDWVLLAVRAGQHFNHHEVEGF